MPVYVFFGFCILLGKVCYQLTGSSDFTLKSLLPVNWQQRIYVKIAATSELEAANLRYNRCCQLTGSSDFNVNSLLPVKFLFLF